MSLFTLKALIKDVINGQACQPVGFNFMSCLIKRQPKSIHEFTASLLSSLDVRAYWAIVVTLMKAEHLH